MDSSIKDSSILTQYETPSQRLARKAREAPFMPIGIAGLVVACGIGAYKFKNRGTMPASVYLMQLRVIAQGTVVGSLAIGISYAMFKDFFRKPVQEQKSSLGQD